MNKINYSMVYFLSLPIAFMTLFLFDAIKFKGRWIIDMTLYNEYEIEVLLFVIWFLILIVKHKQIALRLNGV